MRNSKIVALVATTALLVLGAAFTAFAATGWVEENGVWKYYDKYGNAVTQEWVTSGSDKYWLDENGEMAKSLLIDDGSDYWYVDESGKRVTNKWEKIANTTDDDGDEYYWYFFQANGKAYKDETAKKLKTINDKKYIFNGDGHMLYGWIGSSNSNDEDKWWDAPYYGGGQDDGHIQISKWKQLQVVDNREDADIDQNYWFYFGSDGKKIQAAAGQLKEKSINGKGYVFDDCGVMKSSWEQAASTSSAASASISGYYYFQKPEDGSKLKKQWFRVAPAEKVNKADNETETPHWYYANGDGTIAKDCTKTIKGKKYLFNTKGEMVAGLVELNVAEDGTATYKAVVETTTRMDELTKAGATPQAIAFFGDEETDGSMKTGTVKTQIDGEDYTIVINTTGAAKGLAVNGMKNSNWYVNGVKLCADGDIKVQAFEAKFGADGKPQIVGRALTQKEASAKGAFTGEKTYALLTNSGSIVKNGTKKDADGLKYTVVDYYVVDAAY